MEGPEVLGAAAANSASAIDANIKSKSTRVKPHALLQEAAQLKTEGNAFYQEKNVRSAIGRYHRALLVLRAIDTDVTMAVKGFGPEMPVLSPAQEEMLRKTQVDCYNNLAACLLQRPSVDYARVQEYSLRVLQWRPADIKALYRAGVATLELGDAQAAKQYLIQASRGQPNDANVRKHLQRAEEKLNQDLQREKAMYQGMFSTGSRTGLAEEVNQSNGTGGEEVHQLVTGVCQLNVANK